MELKYNIDENGCWIFSNAKNPKGYGIVRRKGKNYLAHRWQYMTKIGPIPDGMQVCHTCDNPSCVNPDHLWIGTNQENHLDKVAKGRHLNQNTDKSHCHQGHEFTKENTRVKNGRRHCRTCVREYMREKRLAARG